MVGQVDSLLYTMLKANKCLCMWKTYLSTFLHSHVGHKKCPHLQTYRLPEGYRSDNTILLLLNLLKMGVFYYAIPKSFFSLYI